MPRPSRRTVLLFLAGTVFGIFLVISCGKEAASLAEAAIDILFDNTDTSLEAQTVQDAIKELDSRQQALSKRALPVLRDAQGNEIGLLLSPSSIFIPSLGLSLSISDYNGTLPNHILQFENVGCSGTPYATALNPFQVVVHGNTIYTVSAVSTTVTINSEFIDGACVSPVGPYSSVVRWPLEAAAVGFPVPLQGPLQLVY